jgi:hypothetical protein
MSREEFTSRFSAASLIKCVTMVQYLHRVTVSVRFQGALCRGPVTRIMGVGTAIWEQVAADPTAGLGRHGARALILLWPAGRVHHSANRTKRTSRAALGRPKVHKYPATQEPCFCCAHRARTSPRYPLGRSQLLGPAHIARPLHSMTRLSYLFRSADRQSLSHHGD